MRLVAVLGTSLVGATALGSASCTKGTGPEVDASVRPADARGSGDAGSGMPRDAGPTDGAPTDGAAGSDAMLAPPLR